MKALIGLIAGVAMLCVSMVAAQTSGNIGYPALTQIDYNYFGGGARAMAMGYAFVGLANDVSSGIWNPAGLRVLEKPMVAASYNMYRPVGQYTQNLTSTVTKNNLDMEGVAHFSFVAPVRIKGHPFVFNFNYDRSSEYSTKSGYFVSLPSFSNMYQSYENRDKGYSRNYSFGGSTRLYRQLSAGVLVNVIDGRRILENQGIVAADVIIDPVYNITERMVMNGLVIDSTTSNGLNLIGGLMYKAEKFSVGGTVHTPFTMKHSTDRGEFLVTTFNGLPSVNGSDTIYVLDSLAKQDVPLAVALGLGLFPKENLTLTLDVNYQNYGSTNWYYLTDYFISASGDRSDNYLEVPIDWNNIFGIGAGAEYILKTPLGHIAVRAGVRYDQLPKPGSFTITTDSVGYDSDNNPYPLNYARIDRVAQDRQNEFGLSLGTGLHWSQIELDIAYRYTAGREMTQRMVYINFDETDEANPVKTTVFEEKWEQKAHEVRVTFTGSF